MNTQAVTKLRDIADRLNTRRTELERSTGGYQCVLRELTAEIALVTDTLDLTTKDRP